LNTNPGFKMCLFHIQPAPLQRGGRGAAPARGGGGAGGAEAGGCTLYKLNVADP
jgi:hypothetical protein